MVNWPGAGVSGSPSTGSSSSVQTPGTSRRRLTTANGRGVIDRPPAGASAGEYVAIDVQEAEPRPAQALAEHLRKARHQVVAERGIGVELVAQAGGVELDGAHELERAAVEVPPVRREQPRPPDHVAG